MMKDNDDQRTKTAQIQAIIREEHNHTKDIINKTQKLSKLYKEKNEEVLLRDLKSLIKAAEKMNVACENKDMDSFRSQIDDVLSLVNQDTEKEVVDLMKLELMKKAEK